MCARIHVHARMSAKKHKCCFLTFPSYLPLAHFYLDLLFCLCCSVPPSFDSTASRFSAVWGPDLERPDRSVLRILKGYTAPLIMALLSGSFLSPTVGSRQNPPKFSCYSQIVLPFFPVNTCQLLEGSSYLRYFGHCMAFLPCSFWGHTSLIASCSSLTACVLHLEGIYWLLGFVVNVHGLLVYCIAALLVFI